MKPPKIDHLLPKWTATKEKASSTDQSHVTCQNLTKSSLLVV